MSEHRMPDLIAVRVINRAEHLLTTIGWTQGAEARHDSRDQHVISYCLMGALNRAAYDLGLPSIPRIVHTVINDNSGGDFVNFNDRSTTHIEDVIDLLERSREEILRGPKTPPDADPEPDDDDIIDLPEEPSDDEVGELAELVDA